MKQGMHRHLSWKGLAKWHRFSLPCFLLLPTGHSINVRQALLRSKHLIIEEESGHLPVSGADVMKYSNEQVTLAEVMGLKRQISRCGKATLQICMVVCPSET